MSVRKTLALHLRCTVSTRTVPRGQVPLGSPAAAAPLNAWMREFMTRADEVGAGFPANGRIRVLLHEGSAEELEWVDSHAALPTSTTHAIRGGSAVAEVGARVDFVAVHMYDVADPSTFLEKLQEIHATYRRPIWITEFAKRDWSASTAGTNKYSVADVTESARACCHYVFSYEIQ